MPPPSFWPVDRTLIMHVGAHSWQIVPTLKSAGNGRFISVSAGPDDTAWVGGYHCVSGCGTGLEADRTLLLRWQGTQWAAG